VQLRRYRRRDSVIDVDTVATFPWSAVRKISAFERDLSTVDLICLAFQQESSVVEVNEEMVGYQSLVEALPRRFPGLDESWWEKVAFPAFETRWTTVWEASA
jgi:hypothetical protein